MFLISKALCKSTGKSGIFYTLFITPRNQEELIQVLEHHYLCMFENLSSFPDWLSDLLSQACTGGGFSKRKLYTDDEDIIYHIQRCIGLNGINLLVSRADLMDRTILLRMADFMRWGVAIAKSLGYKANDFIQAYQANIESQNAEVINSNTLAQAVLTFMQDKESWHGTVKQAFEEPGKQMVITKDDNTFPKRPNKLRNHLNRVKANFLEREERDD